MRTSTEERVRSAVSSWIAPDKRAKRPCTLEMPMWRTWNWTAELVTSMSQVLAAMFVSSFVGSVIALYEGNMDTFPAWRNAARRTYLFHDWNDRALGPGFAVLGAAVGA